MGTFSSCSQFEILDKTQNVKGELWDLNGKKELKQSLKVH